MFDFIPAEYYYDIYLIIVTLFSLPLLLLYSNASGSRNIVYQNQQRIALFMAIFMTIFVGLRPVDAAFADMVVYDAGLSNFYGKFQFIWNTQNKIFDNFYAFFGTYNLGGNLFFTTIAAIYFLTAYYAMKRLFPNDIYIAYLVFLGAFSTFSYGTNGMKAGMAASIFLLALAYRDKLKVCIPLLLISWGFHHSMQLPLAAFALTLIYKNSKTYFLFWFVCFLLACFHVTSFQEWFGGLTDEQGTRYLLVENEESDTTIKGFRFDFILYSIMPIVVGWYAVYRKGLQLSKFYTCLLNLYLTTNAIWMLCMYASFTNRIAYLSWQLYPVVLIYPFLNEDWGEKKYKILSTVAGLHLAFTLFMTWVYYAD